MTLKARHVDDVVILDFAGRLTLGEPTFLLRQLIRELLGSGYRKFIFNLGEVHYIDSAGLGELVACFTSVRKCEGVICLLNLTQRARGLLQMTKLLTVFDTYTDEAVALEKLKSTPSAP